MSAKHEKIRKVHTGIHIESQNHRMAWVEKDHNAHLVSTPLLCAGSPTSRPGCPEPHPAWPWMPAGMGIHSLLGQPVQCMNLGIYLRCRKKKQPLFYTAICGFENDQEDMLSHNRLILNTDPTWRSRSKGIIFFPGPLGCRVLNSWAALSSFNDGSVKESALRGWTKLSGHKIYAS